MVADGFNGSAFIFSEVCKLQDLASDAFLDKSVWEGHIIVIFIVGRSAILRQKCARHRHIIYQQFLYVTAKLLHAKTVVRNTEFAR